MTKFVVTLNNKKREKLTNELLNAHVNHLKELSGRGRLFLCGPFKDDLSAIQVLIARDYSEAKLLAQGDPFIAQGYYASFEVNELIEANEENNWLMRHSQTKKNLEK